MNASANRTCSNIGSVKSTTGSRNCSISSRSYSAIGPSDSAQVLLFGTFHFQDAGLDVVKHKDVDVFTAESQEYLQGLSERLAEFKPTRVLLEYGPE